MDKVQKHNSFNTDLYALTSVYVIILFKYLSSQETVNIQVTAQKITDLNLYFN
jgi:hypothetical protein